MSTTTPGSFAALQNMRCAPRGQSVEEQVQTAGSGMYVVLDGRLKAKREQETREAVERLQATSRRSGPRKAWGAGSKQSPKRKGLRVGHAGVGVATSDVRRSLDASPPRNNQLDESAAGGAVDIGYVRRMEAQMQALQQTVSQLQHHQQSVSVDPGFLSKIDRLKQDHSKNVGTIERLFKEKQAAERKAARLEAELERARTGGSSQPKAEAKGPSARGAKKTRGAKAAKKEEDNPWAKPAAAERYGGEDNGDDGGGFDFSGGQGGGDECAPPDMSALAPEDDDDDMPARPEVDSPSHRHADADLAASQDDLSWARRVRDVYLSQDRSRSGSHASTSSADRRRASSADPMRRSSKARTQPKPFMMTVRDSSKTQNRRQQELEEKRRAELEAQAEEEALRLRRSRGGAFKGLMQREEDRKRRAADREAKLKEEQRLASSRQFKANPVPRSMVSEDYTVRKEAEERARRERVAKRSQELLAKSQMPPRMKLREVSTAQQRSAAKSKDATKTSTQAPPKPRKVPDFDRLKRRWEHKLTAVRMKNTSTQPAPFAMEDRQKVHDAKREERLRKREEKEAAERKAQADQEKRRRAAAMRAGPKGSQGTTKAVELRMQAVKKAEEDKALAEEAEARKERARKSKQERASRELRPVIAAMEKERKELMQAQGGGYVELNNVVPGPDGEVPEQARALLEEQQRKFREKRQQNKQQIASALDKRPTLFERSEIQRRSEDAKRKALATIAQNVYSSADGGSASAAWKQMAQDDDLLDDDEKALMGLDASEEY